MLRVCCRGYRGVRKLSGVAGGLPLDGVKVLDLSRVLAGPMSTQLLADMGADVIKVEQPGSGDDTRAWGPPFAENGESAYYLCANRNKRSIVADLKTREGQQIVYQLTAKADVVVENFLPGKTKKLGVDYDTLSALNPKLVYASITGYGQTGPYSQRPGYDVMVSAEFGLMHITGYPDGPPAKPGVALTDLTTGLYTALSVLGALRYAEKTGQGQYLDVALADCQLASLANIASNVLVSGKRDSGRHGTEHPSICPYQAFPTKDGRIMLGCGNDKLFRSFCATVGRDDWAKASKYLTNKDRVANRSELAQEISKITTKFTTRELEEMWEGRGFPYAPINDILDSLQHPQANARNMITEVTDGSGTTVKLVSPPVKWSKTPPQIRRSPPLLGQHTDEILAELKSSQ